MADHITVSVQARFLPEQSDPVDSRYVFGYTITIHNHGDKPTQLISRHWVITDENDSVQEVEGLGVVGKQPVILPGEHYTYSSGAILSTETGTMTGTYQMKTDDGSTFEAQIPTFALIPPNKLH